MAEYKMSELPEMMEAMGFRSGTYSVRKSKAVTEVRVLHGDVVVVVAGNTPSAICKSD